MTVAVERFEIELKLKPIASNPHQKLYGGEIEVDAVVHLVNDGTSPVEQVDLNLYRLLCVSEVRDSSGGPLRWRQTVKTIDDRCQVNLLQVELGHPVPAGDSTSIRVSYAGPVCGYPEYLPYVWDHVGEDFTLLRSDVKWYPTVHGVTIPERPFGYVLTVTAPSKLIIVGEGNRTELEADENARVVRYCSPGGHTYRFTVVAAPYRVLEVGDQTEVYLLGDESPVRAISHVLNEVEEACSQWLGTPPGGLLRIAEVPNGYGSEASQGLILQVEGGFGRGLSGDQAFQHALSAFGHEAIHRWHPKPAPSDRTRLMDEGLTHYLEARLLERSIGPGAFFERMEAYRTGFLRASPDAHATPIVEAGGSDHVDIISRGKGPWVFSVMHAWLGDSAFFDILRSYASQFRGNMASWQDFLNVAQERSQEDLATWEDDWLRTAKSSKLLAQYSSLDELAAQYR